MLCRHANCGEVSSVQSRLCGYCGAMDAGQREDRDAEAQVDDIVHTAYDSAGLARPSTAYEAGLAREIELQNFSTNPIADAEALVFPDAQKQGGCVQRAHAGDFIVGTRKLLSLCSCLG